MGAAPQCRLCQGGEIRVGAPALATLRCVTSEDCAEGDGQTRSSLHQGRARIHSKKSTRRQWPVGFTEPIKQEAKTPLHHPARWSFARRRSTISRASYNRLPNCHSSSTAAAYDPGARLLVTTYSATYISSPLRSAGGGAAGSAKNQRRLHGPARPDFGPG